MDQKLTLEDYKHMVEIDNKWCRFEDVILSESFGVTETEYGVDLKDKKWLSLENDVYVTFFRKKSTYVVSLTLYEDNYNIITFSVSGDDNINSLSNIEFKEYISSLKNVRDLTTKFKFKREGRGTAQDILVIFNNIIFMFSEGIKKFNLTNISFTPYSPNLEKVYNKMVETKSFRELLNSLNFESYGTDKVGKGGDVLTRYKFQVKD